MDPNPRIRLAMLVCCLACTQSFGQFYHPDRKEYQTPGQYGLKYESVTFLSKDGTRLHGWFIPATRRAIGTVVHFHGNAQNMTAHFSFVSWLPAEGFNLFLFDYRGYGRSEGEPSRAGVHEDGIAALRYIGSRKGVDPDTLFVLGQSLGGAVAVSAIGSTDVTGIRGIVVESTFESYREIAKDKAPDILATLFISDKLSPCHFVDNIAPVPIVFVHGTRDRIVPYARGKALYDGAKKPKGLWTVRGGKHTEAFSRYRATYRPRLVAFFKKCLEPEEETSRASEK